MKSIFVSTVLFSSLIVALPTEHSARAGVSTANIQLKTGDCDTSVEFSVPVGKLIATTDRSLSSATAGVSARVIDANIFCQAFSDIAGTKKLGFVFTNVDTASFTTVSSGSFDFVSSQAVPIGAFCCVTSTDGFDVCGGSGSSPTSASVSSTSKPSTSTSGTATPSSIATSSSSNSTVTARPSSASVPTVKVQLNGFFKLAVQGEVPADDSIFLIAGHPPLFNDVISAVIVDTEGLDGPTCQAFADVEGNIVVGGPPGGIGAVITTDVTLLDGNSGEPVKILALKCKH